MAWLGLAGLGWAGFWARLPLGFRLGFGLAWLWVDFRFDLGRFGLAWALAGFGMLLLGF